MQHVTSTSVSRQTSLSPEERKHSVREKSIKETVEVKENVQEAETSNGVHNV